LPLLIDLLRRPYNSVALPCDTVITGSLPRSGKLPVLNLLTGQKSGFFFAPQGRLVAPIHVKLGMADGHLGRLVVQNFTSIGAGVWECRPKISKFPLFRRVASQGRTF